MKLVLAACTTIVTAAVVWALAPGVRESVAHNLSIGPNATDECKSPLLKASEAGSITMHVHSLQADVNADGAEDQVWVQENRLSTPTVASPHEDYASGFDLKVRLQIESKGGLATFAQASTISTLRERPESLAALDHDGDGFVDLKVDLNGEQMVYRGDGTGGFIAPTRDG